MMSLGKLIGKGLACIRHYHKVRLDLLMLRVAMEYWDPTQLVLCFNKCELYPKIEEFAALMNYNNFTFILLPPKPKKAIEVLDEHLEIPYSLGKT